MGREEGTGRALLRLALSVLGAALLLTWILLRFVDVAELRRAMGQISSLDLLRPAVVAALALLLSAQRWRTLVRGMGYRIPFGLSLFAVLAAWPLAAVTPSRLGDALRAAVVRDRAPLVAGVGSIVVERLLDVQSLVLLASAGAFASGQRGWGAVGVSLLVVFWTGILIIARLACSLPRTLSRGTWRERVTRLTSGLQRLSSDRRRALAAAVMSLATWMLSLWIISDLLSASGASVPFEKLLLAWPAAVVASAVPLTLSGLGVRDGIFLAIAVGLLPDLDRGGVLTATLLYPAVTSWLFALIGAPFLMRAIAGDRAWRRLDAERRREPDSKGDEPEKAGQADQE